MRHSTLEPILTALFVVVIVALGACQQDPGADKWPFTERVDAGNDIHTDPTDTQSEDARSDSRGDTTSPDFTRLADVPEGQLGFVFDGQLFARAGSDNDPTTTIEWRTLQDGRWMAGVGPDIIDGSVRNAMSVRAGNFIVASRTRVAAGTSELFRAPLDTGSFRGPVFSQFSGDLQLAVGSDGELLVRENRTLWAGDPESGDFKDITPDQLQIGVSDVAAFQGSVFVRGSPSGDVFSRRTNTDRWQRDPVASGQTSPPSEWVQTASGLRALGPSEQNSKTDRWTVQLPSSFFGVFTEQSIQSPEPLRRRSLAAIDRTLFALGTSGRLYRIETQQARARSVVDHALPVDQMTNQVTSHEGRLYTTVTSGNQRAVLSWAPGASTWRVEPIGRATVRDILTADSGLWVNAGALQQWAPNSDRWQLPRSAPGPFQSVIEADDAIFIQRPNSCLHKVADTNDTAWPVVAEWNVGEGPLVNGCDDTGSLGRFTAAVSFDGGYAFGHRAGVVDGSPATEEGGVAFWNPPTSEVSRIDVESLAANALGVRDLAASQDELWVLAIPPLGSGAPPRLHRKISGQSASRQNYGVVDADGDSLDVEDVELLELQSAREQLFARAEITTDSDDTRTRVAAWRPDQTRFELLPRPETTTSVFLTTSGPFDISDSRIRRWSTTNQEWQPLTDDLPRPGASVADIATHRNSLFISLKPNGLYQLPLP